VGRLRSHRYRVDQTCDQFAAMYFAAPRLRPSAPGLSGWHPSANLHPSRICSRPLRANKLTSAVISSSLLCSSAKLGQGAGQPRPAAASERLPAPLIRGHAGPALKTPCEKTRRFRRNPNCWGDTVQPQAAVIQQTLGKTAAGRAHPVAGNG